eukprot:CAMPEP_0197932568 /NCGR_PEP_ID=MMETSP1439-20131203/108811_1 /TAXON_ID=66791 /ORGANISM="Gonyaulax spinifera, Strain CCMP409" /LENGTH=37 /DNA_ID= /DNA_START= /DNA_END= /DNA_ORIENTATION=
MDERVEEDSAELHVSMRQWGVSVVRLTAFGILAVALL